MQVNNEVASKGEIKQVNYTHACSSFFELLWVGFEPTTLPSRWAPFFNTIQGKDKPQNIMVHNTLTQYVGAHRDNYTAKLQTRSTYNACLYQGKGIANKPMTALFSKEKRRAAVGGIRTHGIGKHSTNFSYKGNSAGSGSSEPLCGILISTSGIIPESRYTF